MIIAFKGYVRMKGSAIDCMDEFITIAAALMEEDDTITTDVLKGAIIAAHSIVHKGRSPDDNATD